MLKLLESPEKLHWPTAIKTLAAIGIFFAGWIGNDRHQSRGEHPRYVAKLVAVLNQYDEAQFDRDYNEARASNRDRGRANQFRIIHSLLYEAERDSCSPARVLKGGIWHPESPVPIPIRDMTIDHLVQSHKRAKKLGLYSNQKGDDDLFLGKAPTITKGPYKGKGVHIDHRIPAAVAPQLGLTLLNLQWMEGRENINKHADVTCDGIMLLHQLIQMNYFTEDVLFLNFKAMKLKGGKAASIAESWERGYRRES